MTTRQKALYTTLVATVLVAAQGCDFIVSDETRIERAEAYIADDDYRSAEIELKNVLRSDADSVRARALLGEALLALGAVDGAIKELERARTLGAPASAYLVPYARALARRGDAAAVLELDADLLTEDARRAEMLAIMGRADLSRGNLTPAIERLEQALDLDPGQPDALVGLAHVLRQRGDIEAAELRLAQVLDAHPDKHDALAALAALQAARGDYEGAEATLERALAAADKPGEMRDRLEYLLGIADAQIARGDYKAAQATGARAMAQSNDHPAAIMQAARADLMVGEYDAVVEKTDRIITVAPEYDPPRLLLAAAAIAKGDNALATTHLEAILNRNPKHEAARKMLAEARMNLGSPGGALEALQPLLAASNDTDARLMAMAGTASIRSGDTSAGLEFVQRGVEASSNDPAILLQAAANYLAAGEINQAVELLERLPEGDDVGHRELLLILALLRKGDNDGARAQAEAILAARPGDAAAHRLMGGFHLAVGEFDSALSQFETALELEPDELSTLVNLARVDVELGQPERARARFSGLLQRKPGDLGALIALAHIAERGGDREEAMSYLERANKHNPNAPSPAVSLARYYLQSDQLDKAGARAEQAVRVGPSVASAHLTLGLVRLRQGRDAEAVASFERSVALAPNDSLGHFHLGRAQEKLGKLDAANRAYERALELDEKFYPARAAMIGVSQKRGDYKSAIALVGELEKSLPDRVEPLILRGDIEMSRGKPEDALAAYERAAAKAPSRDLAFKRAETLRQMGRQGFWTVVDDWVGAHPDDTVARTALAESLAASGNLARARAEYEQVFALAPSAAAATSVARVYARENNNDKAAEWLGKAIAIDPADYDARAVLAAVELRRGNNQRALQMARKLRTDHPQKAEAHRIEGDVLSADGNVRAAIEAYERAQALEPSALTVTRLYRARTRNGDSAAARGLEQWLRDNPGDLAVAMTLAQDHTARKDYTAAINTYRRALEQQPDNVIALNNLAWLYYQRGEPGDLQSGIDTAAKAYQQRRDLGAVADTYGWLLLEDGKIEAAVAALRDAIAAAPDDAEIGYHYAVALHRSGAADEARSLLDKILQSDADFASRDDARALRDEL